MKYLIAKNVYSEGGEVLLDEKDFNSLPVLDDEQFEFDKTGDEIQFQFKIKQNGTWFLVDVAVRNDDGKLMGMGFTEIKVVKEYPFKPMYDHSGGKMGL
jgi:hypothetical protein